MSFVSQATILLGNYHFVSECSNQVMEYFYKLFSVSVKRLPKGYMFTSNISLAKVILGLRMQYTLGILLKNSFKYDHYNFAQILHEW